MEHPLLSAAEVGAVTTFYAYRGGAGCSMALAHIAVLLADRGPDGTPVLMLDWDLPAPGLHHYFPAAHNAPGVVELFMACRDQLLLHGPAAQEGDGDGGEALAQTVLAAVDWQRYVVRVDPRRPLFLMRAGRLDDGYAQRLAGLDWEALFHACPALFRCFGAMLARHFRHVLVDAPHGRSDGAGICTALLPQRLVLLFDANRPGLDGLASLVQRVATYRLSHDAEPRALMMYPAPARMAADDSAQRARLRHGDPAAGLPGYQPLFERALGAAYGVADLSLDSYFNEVLLPQSRELAGAEALGPERGCHGAGDRCAPARAYEALLAWLEPGHPPWCAQRELALLADVAQARAGRDGSAAREIALAHALACLGDAYCDGGRDAHALLAYRESSTLYAAAAGDAHLDTAAARARLAALLLRRQHYDEARLLLRQAGEARTAALGPRHPDVLAVAAMQALALAGQGYLTAALARQQEVLDVQLRTHGAAHPATLETLAQRAALLSRAGDLEQARQLLEQVLAARTRLSGAQHPATLRVASLLSHTAAQAYACTDVAPPPPLPPPPDALRQPDNVYALRESRSMHGETENGAGRA
ncbi:MAG: tetratricopeptide repeat protein [Burkholderiaceae bacterium]|nr:tetratricopeptide repeat protein [Burkholderiaceae bacterium]